MLWRIVQVVNEEILSQDPDSVLTSGAVKEIQVDVLEMVFGVMSKEGRSEMINDDHEFVKKRVRTLIRGTQPATVRRFAVLDRVVCNIGGSRGWAAGEVQALNEEDPSDPTGQAVLAYVVNIDPPNSRLVSVPKDSNQCVRAEVCFGQRAGALWFTRMCLPKTGRQGRHLSRPRRFSVGDRVACAVEDRSNEYTDWAAGTVVALDYHVEDEDGVPGGLAPYQVCLDTGSTVLVHVDEHWLIRDLALQLEGPRIAADGTRCLTRMGKRKIESGWEHIDHM